MSYTDQQIKQVCDKAAEVLHGLTDAQNVTFPSTAIISGMKEGLSADVIANNARDAIIDLPLLNNGTYNWSNYNMKINNIASFMRGAVYNAIKELESGSVTPTPDSTPEPTPNPTPESTPESTPEITPTPEPTPTNEP
jgi:hypothetical protein